MKILGLSAYYHDSAAALISESEILCAAQEERFTRRKHDRNFPAQAVQFCLQNAGVKLSELDAVCFYEKPFLKFERVIESHLWNAPLSFPNFVKSFESWISDKLFLKQNLLKELKKIDADFDPSKLLWSEHHLSHAASAFYPSPFSDAAILTLDGVGELATTSIAEGTGNQINLLKEIHFPHSLGLFYSAFTYFCGFKVDSGEYKLMGLAPYGKPIYKDLILEKMVTLQNDGSFELNMNYFGYEKGLIMTTRHFAKLFGCPVKKPDEPLLQIHFDIASSAQAALETLLLELIKHVRTLTKSKNLCLAGGVALNCVANAKLKSSKLFENIWIQPASGDAGGALGAALAARHLHFQKPRTPLFPDAMSGAQLGPKNTTDEIRKALKAFDLKFHELSEAEMITTTAKALSAGAAVGWHQGRMEFGPRALGNRSILADPRGQEVQTRLNLKIKFRESFRPFAPSVLSEKADEWFSSSTESPYMLFTANVLEKHCKPLKNSTFTGMDLLKQPRSKIQAITHVDYSARLQTVNQQTNPLYHQLLKKFFELTDCPMLVNTSFNVRGEPIVCSPADSIRCFLGTGLDLLVIGHFVIKKEENLEKVTHQHAKMFAAD